MTKEEIDKINKQYRTDHNKPHEGNVSQADNSSITHPDKDDKRSIAEGIIAELGDHKSDIEAIKLSMQQIAEKINQQTQALNNLGQGQLPATQQAATTAGGLNMDALVGLGDVAEKLVSAYKNLKGAPTSAPSFIDAKYIEDQVKASVMGNFEIGNALISNLKGKLINKAVTSSVTEALKDTNVHQPG